MQAFMARMQKARTSLLVSGLLFLTCLPGGTRAQHALKLMCNNKVCADGDVMKVGDVLTCSGESVDQIYLDISGYEKTVAYPCEYTWKVPDIGPQSVLLRYGLEWDTTILQIHVVTDLFGGYNVLCNWLPCLEDGIMKPGERISIYVEWRTHSEAFYNVILNGVLYDNVNHETWSHTLDVNDVGRMTITFTTSDNSRTISSMTRNIVVISEPLVGIDIVCNGKFCKDDEIMRFGDEISCYFEPKAMSYGMNFALLIDDYVKVEGYPCSYTLKEEDVGRKLVKCNSDGKYGPFNRERYITFDCAFRDAVVLRPTIRAVILCGDEPCDKPGRTIYTGTYISCRMNDSREAYLTFTVNGELVSATGPPILKEIYYKFQYKDVYNTTAKTKLDIPDRIGPITATCKANGTDYDHTSNVTVSFTVHDWPCLPEVKPTSANIYDSLLGVDILCNDKFCEYGQPMRFGDELSCYFEPKAKLDGVNFTLLIDRYVKVEGFPCTYRLREEDVGTKTVQCNAISKINTFERTRNISVACEFRDPLVVRRAMLGVDKSPFKLIFRMSNATSRSDVVIILCGDAPCDEPGRTIYSGTYVSCRLNYGHLAHLDFKVNVNFGSWKLPEMISESSYLLKAGDVSENNTHFMLAKCVARDTRHVPIGAKAVHFLVKKWPCPANVMPASADMFEFENAADGSGIPEVIESIEHGDAAGAIDVDQSEHTEHGDDAGAIDVDQGEHTDRDDKSKSNIGCGQKGLFFLQLIIPFIATFVGGIEF